MRVLKGGLPGWKKEVAAALEGATATVGLYLRAAREGMRATHITARSLYETLLTRRLRIARSMAGAVPDGTLTPPVGILIWNRS